jgi:hypothetical protein
VVEPRTWRRERMRLELNDRMLRVSNGRRRRRLLIDVAIGNIRGAFGVGVFALISERPVRSIYHTSAFASENSLIADTSAARHSAVTFSLIGIT